MEGSLTSVCRPLTEGSHWDPTRFPLTRAVNQSLVNPAAGNVDGADMDILLS